MPPPVAPDLPCPPPRPSDRPRTDSLSPDSRSPDSLSPAERARARGTWISLLSQIVAALLASLLQIVLARSLGAPGFGAYAAVLAWIGPLAVLGGAGLPAASVRLLSAFAAQRDAARHQGFLRASQRLVIAITCSIAAVGTALALAFAPDPKPWIAGLWTLPPSVLVALRTEIARASGRFEAAFLLPLLQPVAMLSAALAGKAILGSITPALALLLPALGALVVLAAQRALFRARTRGSNLPEIEGDHRTLARDAGAPERPAASTDEAPGSSILRDPKVVPIVEARAWLRVGIAILSVDAAHLLLSQADALLVGAMRGSQAVALLGVAGATAGFAMFPMIAVGATSVPAFAARWAVGDRAEVERLAQRAVRRAFAAQVLVALAILAVARPVLALYGASFADARAPLLFVLAGQLANTGTGYVGSIMTMTGHQDIVGRAIWPAAALNVALVIAATHLFGVPGAAAGTAISSLLWNLWLHRLVVRHTGMRVSFVDAIAGDLSSIASLSPISARKASKSVPT